MSSATCATRRMTLSSRATTTPTAWVGSTQATTSSRQHSTVIPNRRANRPAGLLSIIGIKVDKTNETTGGRGLIVASDTYHQEERGTERREERKKGERSEERRVGKEWRWRWTT